MKTTNIFGYHSGETDCFKGQRGFLSIALGLALTVLFGTTSAIIVKSHEKEEMHESSTMQQLDVETIQTASISGI